ncbi:MAG: hypothetical protein WDW36_009692 [Sanguina aurantia]
MGVPARGLCFAARSAHLEISHSGYACGCVNRGGSVGSSNSGGSGNDRHAAAAIGGFRRRSAALLPESVSGGVTVSVGSQVAMTELRRRSTPMPGLAEAWLTGDGEHINARTSLLEGMAFSNFNFFYYTHYLLLLMLPLILVHPPPTTASVWAADHMITWIGPILVLIVAQRLWSYRLQTVQQLSVLGFEGLPCSVILLHVQKPPGFRYHPGYSVSINVPGVSALEWHPFTIASAPHHRHLSFVIGTKGDWTASLARKLERQQQGSSSALLLEGADAFEQGGSACPGRVPPPLLANLRYACATRCRHMQDHEALLLMAGGTGISAFLSLLASLTCPAYVASKVSKLRSLTLVWSVQDAQLASLVTEPLQLLQEQQLQSQKQGGPPLPFSIQLHIHVTSPSQTHPAQIATPTETAGHALHTALAPSAARPHVTVQHTALALPQSSRPTPTSAPGRTTSGDTTSQAWFASLAQSATAAGPGGHHHTTAPSGTQHAAERPAPASGPQPSSKLSRELSGGVRPPPQPSPAAARSARLLDNHADALTGSRVYGSNSSTDTSGGGSGGGSSGGGGGSGGSGYSGFSSSTQSRVWRCNSTPPLEHILSIKSGVAGATCPVSAPRNKRSVSMPDLGMLLAGGRRVMGDRRAPAQLSVEFHQGRPDYATYTAAVCELGCPPSNATNPAVRFPTGRLATVGVFVCGPAGMRLGCQEAFLGLDEGLRRNAKWYDQEFKR